MSNLSLYFGENFITLFQGKPTNQQLEVNLIDRTNTLTNFYNSYDDQLIEKQAQEISKLVESNKVVNKNFNIILTDSFSYNQVLLMPALNEKELISSIKYQADQFIPMPIEETNIDLEILEEYKNEKKLLILIVAASKKIIEKIQKTIEMAGLIPQLIETEVAASSRFFFRYLPIINPQLKSFLAINLSHSTSTLSYYENNPPILKKIHTINLGYQLFIKELLVNFNFDLEKAKNLLINYQPTSSSPLPLEKIFNPLIIELVNEIRKSILDQKVEAIFLFNQIVLFPYLVNLIEKNFNLPVKIFNPEKILVKNSQVNRKTNEFPLYITNFGSIIE